MNVEVARYEEGAGEPGRLRRPNRGVIAPVVTLGALVGTLLIAGPAAADAFSAEHVFTKRCGACHTVGHGVDVGPDLKGVTERRTREWLVPFIQSSQTVIKSGDPTANELFEKFKHTKMPDHPYTAEQINQILDFIAAGGPKGSEPEVRLAATAKPADLRLGRELFFGVAPFAKGGAACVSCHSPGSARGGHLGVNLRGSFDRYRDWEMSKLLRGMDTPVMAAAYAAHPLTDEEVFAVKAYLARLEAPEAADPTGSPLFPWTAFAVAAAVFVVAERRRGGPPRAE